MKFIIVVVVLILGLSHLAEADSSSARDITSSFDIYFSAWDAHSADELFASPHSVDFRPLDPPASINRVGKEAWLRTTLSGGSVGSAPGILEIPGQIFNYIDVWYSLPNGDIEHYYAGDRYPYIERSVKHASTAFPMPPVSGGDIEVLIRARNETAHPMNFAAWVWPADQWQDYLLIKRTWYGAFAGAILVLCIYNLFLCITLRDSSYLYYVGYILCISVCVVLLSGLAEEYLWPEGKPAPFVLALTGMGVFLAVGFVNKFLKIKRWKPSVYWLSTTIAGLALVCGWILVFSDRLPLVPPQYSASVVHVFTLGAGIYFIGVSVVSYFSGVTQARFLALSMLALLSSVFVYFSYTYGLVSYNSLIGHSLEFGVLAEGVLLSLALADRITILTREKHFAERASVETQKAFSRRLIAAQEKERLAVAGALHDSIGHAVLVLKNSLLSLAGGSRDDVIASRNVDNEAIREPVDQCSQIMADVRRLSHDLHPHILKRLGLAAALESTFERALDPAGIDWSLDVDPLPAVLSAEIEISIYRVLQETLNNILKYAQASEVTCRVAIEGNTIRARITDNGVGFDLAKVRGDTLGLEESGGRVRLLGGRFDVESTPGMGTEISFCFPTSYR